MRGRGGSTRWKRRGRGETTSLEDGKVVEEREDVVEGRTRGCGGSTRWKRRGRDEKTTSLEDREVSGRT